MPTRTEIGRLLGIWRPKLGPPVSRRNSAVASLRAGPAGRQERAAAVQRRPRIRTLACDQNPALIFSNSSDCFCRCSFDIGNCASTGVVVSPRPTASSASRPSASIAALFAWP